MTPNSSLSVLEFFTPKRNYRCYSRLHALIHDRNVLYIQRVHMHHPPRPAERERNMGLARGDGKHGTCGPPERRPVKRKRSWPGGTVIQRNIKTPESIYSTLGVADPSLWYFVLRRRDFIIKDFQCQRLVHLFFLTSIPSSPVVVPLVWNPLTVFFAPLHTVSSRRSACMIQILT